MLNENHITELLAKWFTTQGYKITGQLTTNQQGVDLVVESPNGIPHYIEVKGETSSKETSKRYGLEFSRNQIWNHISVAFMKTIHDMDKYKGKDVTFGIACPENHRELLNKVKFTADKLGIRIYIVSEEQVEVL